MTFWQENLSKPATRLVASFFVLPSQERQLLIRALMLLWAVRAGLWAFSFQTINCIMERHPSSSAKKEFSPGKIVWAVKIACRFVPSATCLTQALAARALLSKYGHSANLRIGVARDSERIKAHAWLEKDGRTIIGGSTSEFKPLPMVDDRS